MLLDLCFAHHEHSMRAQVSTTKAYDSTPGFLAVSLGTPPYIAMTLGDKVVTVMDYSGVYKEEVRPHRCLTHP